MSNNSSRNSKAFKSALQDYSDRVIKAHLVDMLKRVAEQFVGVIDGSFEMPEGNNQYPVDTSNLHDATGVGIYVDGAVQCFMPTQRAQIAQYTEDETDIWGSALLEKALHNCVSQFSSGIWLVLFSTVPYAAKVDSFGSPKQRGQGFFEALEQNLLNDVMASLKPISQ